MKHTLLLRLIGPMQSYGTRSKFAHRDTQPAPSKSAVVGMVAAAFGRQRSESVTDIAALRLGVRVDKRGIPQSDFQTAQNIISSDGTKIHDTGVSDRDYLADAAFLVGLEGNDPKFLERINTALTDPWFSIGLGRHDYLPSFPITFCEEGELRPIEPKPLEEALVHAPALKRTKDRHVRYLIEDPGGNVEWWDQPLNNFKVRSFGLRRIRAVIAEKGKPWY